METVFPPSAVTRAAVARSEAVGGSVRVGTVPGGCCGQTYAFTTDDQLDSDSGFGRAATPMPWNR